MISPPSTDLHLNKKKKRIKREREREPLDIYIQLPDEVQVLELLCAYRCDASKQSAVCVLCARAHNSPATPTIYSNSLIGKFHSFFGFVFFGGGGGGVSAVFLNVCIYCVL